MPDTPDPQDHAVSRLELKVPPDLVAIENRLGVYISARGNRVQIEGEAEAAARAEAEADPDFGDDPFAPDDLA